MTMGIIKINPEKKADIDAKIAAQSDNKEGEK